MDNYVYRHRRLDNNEVFYIGVGSGENYKRSMHVHGRNLWWTNTYKRYGRSVEIIADNLLREDAFELEMFLIELYGRKNLEKGNLVNLDNGGQSSGGHIRSEEEIKRIRARNRGKHQNSKKVIDTSTGIVYDCTKDVCDLFNINYGVLKSYLNKFAKNKTHFVYYVEDGDNLSQFHNGSEQPQAIEVIDTVTLTVYRSVLEASQISGIKQKTLSNYLSGERKNKTSLIYKKDYVEGMDLSKNVKPINKPKKIIDTATKKVYDSIKQASIEYGINYSTLKSYLYGRNDNKTTLEYC